MNSASEPVLELVETGLALSFQDLGRRGWKKYGVPPGGALDPYALQWANRLLGNPWNSPVLEILLHGARFRALRRLELAMTGASVAGPAQRWQTRRLDAGQVLTLPPPPGGVWTYLAVPGGFAAERWFGSVSIFPRGGLGRPLCPGDRLRCLDPEASPRSASVGDRWIDPAEQRDYRSPPSFRVWPGPQWDSFGEDVRASFFARSWCVSARSDRTGYRLDGPALKAMAVPIPSEPVLPGSIQIPPDGRPIIIMRDGPTVGGYPKLGLVDPELLSWLAQCRPGQDVRFEPQAVPLP